MSNPRAGGLEPTRDELMAQLVAIQGAAEELAHWPEMGETPFLAWAPGEEKPHQLRPAQVKGIYEAWLAHVERLAPFGKRVIRELAASQSKVKALCTALRPRQEFFEKCWDAARDAQEVGGDDIQEWGEQLGLLRSVRVTEPCGENCWCAEYVGNDFPADCLRLVPILDVVAPQDTYGPVPRKGP